MTERLLPPNATPFERALAETTGRLGDLGVPLRPLWSPDTCPEALLPSLAWTLSVDQWDRRWPEEVKRQAIRGSLRLHRIKGSRASIDACLRDLGLGDAIVIEGVGGELYDGTHDYDGQIAYGIPGEWAEYRVRLARPISADQAALAVRALARVAPARCHLVELAFVPAVALYDAEYSEDGTINYGSA